MDCTTDRVFELCFLVVERVTTLGTGTLDFLELRTDKELLVLLAIGLEMRDSWCLLK